MEAWRKIAIAEIGQLLKLLHTDDFTPQDLRDRLAALLEYIELDPTTEPYQEDSD